ncbi:MAG TPA: cell division protein FtsZ, partial [Dyadobacter sp.]|nr:cell division protein FtsZ [Dyadobacter sp.]
KEFSDTVLVVLNDKLEELYEDMTLTQAFAEADGILLNAVKSISEIITTNGNINTDFKDVEKVLKSAGQSVMGTSEASGTERAQLAIKEALDSPLLNDRDIRGAKRILVTLATSKKKEATMKEQREIWQFVLSQVGGEARMFKLGTITDDSLGDKLRVTIVAAGFDSIESPIPGMQTKSMLRASEEAAAYPEPVQDEFMMTAEVTGTNTGTVDIVIDNEVTIPADEINHVSIIDSDSEEDWTNEEADRMDAMIKFFKEGSVRYTDLEGPAYRRSQIELWRRPAIPANEMEQHWLK